MNFSKSERYINIDIFKAIGIILVIIGHIYINKPIYYWLVSFHMPMFFFISGYLFKNYGFKDLIKRKFKSLIIPYIIWGFINAIACAFMLDNFSINHYLEKFFGFNNEPSIPITGAIWFLTCLFFVNIIFYILNKYCKKYVLEFIIIFLVLLEFIIKIRLPWSLDSAIFMLPIFFAGNKFRQKEFHFNPQIEILLSLIILTITFFTIQVNSFVNVRMNEYSNLFLFYGNALLTSLAFFYISKNLAKIKLVNFIKEIGKQSLDYMCSHQIFLKILSINGISNNWFTLIIILTMINIFIFTKNRCKKLLLNSVSRKTG